MRIMIIGNHAAGLSAAETLRRGDETCEITMISKEDTPPYSRCLIPYIVSGEKEVDDILFRPRDFYRVHNVRTLFGTEVLRVIPEAGQVLLPDGEKTGYDVLIIATGGDPSMPRIPGVKNKGVFGLRTLADAAQITEYCDKVDTAVVLGGGLVGVKAAVALNTRGKKVKIVVGSPNVLSQIISENEAEFFEDYLTGMGVEIITRTNPARILGHEKVEGVETTEGKTIDCQMIVVGKGVRANLGLVKDTGIELEYGIIVDEHCRTNVPAVYAVGDVTQSPDHVRKEKWLNSLWPHAAEEGRVAAENILGRNSTLRSRTSMNSFTIGDLPMISAGLTGAREEIPGAEEVISKHPMKRTSRRFVFKDGRIVGFALVGDVAHAGVLTSLVTRGIDVSKVRDQIVFGNYDFASMLPLIRENQERFSEPEYEEVLAFL